MTSEVWNKFFQRYEEIDMLETQLNEHVKRFRRRVTCAVEQALPYRPSHLRLFVNHTCGEVYTLNIEGRLLTGMLDHIQAANLDHTGSLTTRDSADPNALARQVLPTTVEESSADEVKDRNKYRSVGDIEENPVEPLLFTHAFDKVEVSFQTVWQPETPPQSFSSLTPPKKSRKRKDMSSSNLSTSPKYLQSSKPTKLTWSKEDSLDAHAFVFEYRPEETPESLILQSVVATIVMHPTLRDTIYEPSQSLKDAIFPEKFFAANPSRAESENSKEAGENQTIPVDNHLHAPSYFTMNDILECIFTYIDVNSLYDESDKSLILCDSALKLLLECDSINFGDMEKVLLDKRLVTPLQPQDDPVHLTYVMKRKTMETEGSVSEEHFQPGLSLDMDVQVPAYFPWRAREIIRRIKRREFEYTSSRTKGRYMLVASRGNEDIVKAKIGECISGNGYSAENYPVFLALSKAAPPKSEARGSAQTDAKICALLARVGECMDYAQLSNEAAETCRNFMPSR